MSDPTRTAVTRYLTQKGRDADNAVITDDLVTELGKQSSRVCPLDCPEGQTASGSICVADTPAPSKAATAKADDNSDTQRLQKTQKNRRDNPSSKQAQRPKARQQAEAGGPRIGTTIGVGF
jgi:hypothetical protein